MTFNEIEKEFDEQFNNINIAIVTIESTEGTVSQQPAQDRVKSFLKQSFIKYLQSEVERYKALEDIWLHTDKKTGEKTYRGGQQCRSCMIYRDSIRPIDQITHIEAQIKQIEG